ncbi:MAG: formate dehydrogenase accessory sulfurtransferase FdhD [Pseudomonadota bacterium]
MNARDELVTILTPNGIRTTTRPIALEAPVAFEINGIGYAVMMATPADLTDFATGFLLTERLADTPADLLEIAPFETEAGWIIRVTLSKRCADRIADRVRHRSSETACGLCGIASLEQLRRPIAPAPPPPAIDRAAIFAALANLRAHQPLNAATGAVHAAAWAAADGHIVSAREDVGRHNALDKLIGALAAIDHPPGFLLVTSRLSFEMVDKALVARAGLLVGISAPTALATDHARDHGLTLIALARPDAMLLLNDPHAAFAD